MSWYEVVTGAQLFQGDFLKSITVPIAVSAVEVLEGADEIETDLLTQDVIVLSQSCDLDRDDFESVLLARVDSWRSLVGAQQVKAADRKNVRSQRVHHYQLLPERLEDPAMEWSIIDFRRVYAVPRDYLMQKAEQQGPRLRLFPPYREGVAQAFARFIMRVAYEDDLSGFDNWRD